MLLKTEYYMLLCQPPGCARLFVTPWTVTRQAPLSMGYTRKNIGVGGHSLSTGSSQPRDQIHVSYIAGRFFTTEPLGKPHQGSGIKWVETKGRNRSSRRKLFGEVVQCFSLWGTIHNLPYYVVADQTKKRKPGRIYFACFLKHTRRQSGLKNLPQMGFI